MGEDAVAQGDAQGLVALLRRSARSSIPAILLGLVALIGVALSQGVTPPGPPPSVQQLSPVEPATGARPAPATAPRQSIARRAEAGRSAPGAARPVRSRPRAGQPAAAPQPERTAPTGEDVDVDAEPTPTASGGPLGTCLEPLELAPAPVGC